jgi:hypothetical protein
VAPDNDGDSTNTMQATPATNAVDAAEDSTVVTIGKDGGLLFQKPRGRIQTQQKLKNKRVAHDDGGGVGRATKRINTNYKDSSRASKDAKRKRSLEKMHMSIRGLKMHIDMTVTSPLKHSKL